MQEKCSPKFSDRLRLAMAEAGIKAARLAENACISKGYVSGLLSGTKEEPSFEVVKKIAEVLSCSPTFLLYGMEQGQEMESVLREEPPVYGKKSEASPLRSPDELAKSRVENARKLGKAEALLERAEGK